MRPNSLFRFDNAVRLPALLFGALALVLMVAPGVIYWLFSMESAAPANIISRRTACLFLGLCVMCLQASRWSQVDRVVSAGIVASMGALAVLGVAEFVIGSVGPGIWLAVGTELVLVALFLPHVTR